MELTRRFLFRGNASAYSGQVYRRNDQRLTKPVLLDQGAMCSLTVAGGNSAHETKAGKYLDGFIRVGNAGTESTGSFADFKQGLALTRGEVAEESLATLTKVRAWVENIVMGNGPKELRGVQPEGVARNTPRLSIDWIGGSLSSLNSKPGDEPAIRLNGRETDIKGLTIDGYPVKVELNKTEFDEANTFSKLQTASNDPTFIDKTCDCMSRTSRPELAVAARTHGTVHPAALLHGTIVRKLTWAKKPHPTATIEQNMIAIPDFGKIHLGEIFVSAESRRLTMLRIQFGSPVGGFYACSEVDTNGSWFPPMI